MSPENPGPSAGGRAVELSLPDGRQFGIPALLAGNAVCSNAWTPWCGTLPAAAGRALPRFFQHLFLTTPALPVLVPARPSIRLIYRLGDRQRAMEIAAGGTFAGLGLEFDAGISLSAVTLISTTPSKTSPTERFQRRQSCCGIEHLPHRRLFGGFVAGVAVARGRSRTVLWTRRPPWARWFGQPPPNGA